MKNSSYFKLIPVWGWTILNLVPGQNGSQKKAGKGESLWKKNYYNINELAVISGFTTRSLRNFISMGHLKGEKIDGIWQFTPEEIDEFLSNPNVMPGIKSKANAVVYDFMADTEKKTNKICSVLDYVMEDDEASELSKYYCKAMKDGVDAAFKYEKHGKNVRVIISGPEDFVLDAINGWYKN